LEAASALDREVSGRWSCANGAIIKRRGLKMSLARLRTRAGSDTVSAISLPAARITVALMSSVARCATIVAASTVAFA